MSADSFFERWARRNAEAAAQRQAAAEPARAPAHEPDAAAVPAQPPPTLEDVARLTHDSDFTPFVARGVDENIRRSAMKKLFADPHFNVMDGLDVYIEDYNSFVPLTAAMLARLNHAQALLDPLAHLERPLMRLLDAVAKDEPQLPAQAAIPEIAQNTEDAPQAASTQQDVADAQQDTDHRGTTPPDEEAQTDDNPV